MTSARREPALGHVVEGQGQNAMAARDCQIEGVRQRTPLEWGHGVMEEISNLLWNTLSAWVTFVNHS